MSERSKRHHYIPRFILNEFCIDGKIWVGDKISGDVFRCTPNNIFTERNLNVGYDLEDIEKQHDKFERILQGIECDAAPGVKKIICKARTSEPLQLLPKEREAVKSFYHASCRRTPEFSDEMMKWNESLDDAVNEAVQRTLDNGGISTTNARILDQNSEYQTIKIAVKQNSKARFFSGDHALIQKDVQRFSRDTGLLMAVIHCKKRSFVIGSHGIANVSRGEALGSWFPIAHDVALAPTLFPDKDIFLVLDRKNEHIIKCLNVGAHQQSRFVAGRSEALIRSLMTH